MSQTPNLSLPYIEAAQAQKHVTHNEAIRALDAIVQLAVIDDDLTTPPSTPSDGERHIVAPGASGVWSGRDGTIAIWQDNAWMYYAPQPGWLAWVQSVDQIHAFDGAAWAAVAGSGGGGASVNPTPLVGVNATADSANRLSVASAGSLFNHDGDDHRLTVNKAATIDTASVVFQTGFSGRAEFGTTGDDDFHVKVSTDGTAFREAMVVDGATGETGFPQSFMGGFKNLLINGAFAYNQRAHSGALAAGAYGFDRWRGATGGATISAAGDVVTLSAGGIEQVIESPGLAGSRVTVSVEALSGGDLDIDVAGMSGTITAGADRRSVTMIVPGGATGDITVKVSASGGPVSFRRVQLERGGFATSFDARPLAQEAILCERYFRRLQPGNTGAFGPLAVGVVSTLAVAFFIFRVRMRAAPSLTVSAPSHWSVQNPSGSDVACSAITAFAASPDICEVRLVRAAGLTGGLSYRVRALSANGYMDFDAEL